MDASIIIIGSGYSAAAALVHLAYAGLPLHQVLVIGPGELGAGQAYGCTAESYRLNVRADLQRLWPDQPDHFASWAAAHIQDPDAHTPAGSFYRRWAFARYMTAQLGRIPTAKALRQIDAWATRVTVE
ncbi:MAG: FAD/NAD(P)-binding protein, partial [Proteobacteria bacterium]|nr:FAD/NAD(P)-binding protein [Pseudomonadota bacterium]